LPAGRLAQPPVSVDAGQQAAPIATGSVPPPAGPRFHGAELEHDLIDIRSYLGTPQVAVDAIAAPREAMIAVLARNVDLENYELLHALESMRTREDLLHLLPVYLVDTARRLPPVAYSGHVEALAKLTGISVGDLVALWRQASTRGN
jgi:hypothetical protein